jgi:acetyl esterase/lipase
LDQHLQVLTNVIRRRGPRGVRRGFAVLAALVLTAGTAPAASSPVAPRVVELWPDGSPNNPAGGPRPTMEIYSPFVPEHSLAATIVICPGGGYSGLSPYERLFAEFFRGLGYTAVVVNYRVAPNRHPAPFADATRAIRLLRANAKEWKIPANRLALMGGSAGGHLAALVGTRPDFYRDPADDLAATVSARPDRLILAYPVISGVNPSNKSRSFERLIGLDASLALREAVSAERHVDASTPPAFIFHAADDALVGVEQSLVFAQACWAAKVPAELHVFPRGGHGRLFAYAADVSPRWRALLQDWLAAWIAAPVSP